MGQLALSRIAKQYLLGHQRELRGLRRARTERHVHVDRRPGCRGPRRGGLSARRLGATNGSGSTGQANVHGLACDPWPLCQRARRLLRRPGPPGVRGGGRSDRPSSARSFGTCVTGRAARHRAVCTPGGDSYWQSLKAPAGPGPEASEGLSLRAVAVAVTHLAALAGHAGVLREAGDVHEAGRAGDTWRDVGEHAASGGRAGGRLDVALHEWRTTRVAYRIAGRDLGCTRAGGCTGCRCGLASVDATADGRLARVGARLGWRGGGCRRRIVAAQDCGIEQARAAVVGLEAHARIFAGAAVLAADQQHTNECSMQIHRYTDR